MLLFDRIARRLGGAALPSAVVPRQILLLAAVSILTHPLLDTLNTYGVRWLMPFRGDWSYGDAMFIVDPWLWLALGLGVGLSGRRPRSRGYVPAAAAPARIALVAAGIYIMAMVTAGVAARRVARQELEVLGGAPVERLMVGPRLVTPLVRDVVAVQGESYLVGTFRWIARRHVEAASLRRFPRPGPHDPAFAAAAATPIGRRFLVWARFPGVQVEPNPAGGSLVHLIDLRYADRPGASFGSVTVPVLIPPASVSPAGTHAPPPPTDPAARRR
jgi:inner membrane protein